MKNFTSPFNLFITAEGLSLLSQAAFMLVLPWLILTVTKNVGHASVITTVAATSAIVASLASGHIIDRIGRRKSGILATLGCAVAAAGLAATSASGIINIVWLVGLGLLANSFLIPSMTARDTLMADVAAASGKDLGKVAAARQLVFGITFLAGPGLAGLLITHMSPAFVLSLIAGLWTMAAVCTRFLPVGAKPAAQPAGPSEAGSVWGRMLRSPAIMLALFVALGTCLITAPMTDVLIPAHFRSLNEPQLLGWAMAILSFGSLVGASLYMVLAKLTRFTYVTAILLLTIGFGVLAMLPSFWPLVIGLFLMGVGSSLSSPFLMVAIAKHTKEAERGRVMGLYNTLSLGATPAGLALLSILLSRAALKSGFVAVLIVWLIVAVVMLLGGKRLYTVNQHEPEIAHD